MATKLPLVSVCTPTFNRRPFIQMMFNCFKNQTYPSSRIEWIIVDDGTDKIKDLVESSNIPQIRYFALETKIPLGAKRNFMHEKAKGDIIVYMDDDDYYPPERVAHAVEKLQGSPDALCAGSSEIYLFFKGMNKMIKAGPYGPTHATAGTFAFKRQLLQQTRYNDTAAIAEEREFLKGYTIPFVQLDPMKTILVFSHEHNTYDKRKMFDNAHPDYFRECPKKVKDFIRNDDEAPIEQFFLHDIDDLLANYEPGLPFMKPDVLKQMSEIEIERSRQQAEQQRLSQTQNAPIMMHLPNKESVQLNSHQIVDIITQQKTSIQTLTKEKEDANAFNKLLQQKIIALRAEIDTAKQRISMLEATTTAVEHINMSISDIQV
jgi:glycosyltransferase involved in cell wall biosynthesis